MCRQLDSESFVLFTFLNLQKVVHTAHYFFFSLLQLPSTGLEGQATVSGLREVWDWLSIAQDIDVVG